MLSRLLDIEWLLSTLFDASLLTFKPPETAALFLLSRFGSLKARFQAQTQWLATPDSAGRPRSHGNLFVAPPWNTTRHDLARSGRSGAERHLVPTAKRGVSPGIPLGRPGGQRHPGTVSVAPKQPCLKSSLRGCWTSGPKPRNAASSGVAGASSRDCQLR